MRILNSFNKSQAATKATLIVNGKFDKAAIMRAAWAEAKGFASLPKNAGRKACEFFAVALKSIWNLAKA